MLKKEKFLYPIELIKALLLFQKYVPLDLMLVLWHLKYLSNFDSVRIVWIRSQYSDSEEYIK
jgi:hypothetical protein